MVKLIGDQELFIQELVKDAFKSTQAAGKKVVKYEDVGKLLSLFLLIPITKMFNF